MLEALPKVPVSGTRISDDEIDAAVAVLRSGNLRQGAICARFEQAFADFVGCRYAIAVSSGTAALHLAYLATLQPGDEVLVPSFTFVATASMVVAAGARPILCDVDPGTFTLSVPDAAGRLTERTRAIAPVHLYGNPADVEGVQELARKNGLAIIWDAAQAHGARFADRDVGSLPGLSCYSFYPSKNMTTGEGGMITTDDEELDRLLRILRSQGAQRKYYHTHIGYNFRLTDIQAAIGLAQLERLPDWLEARRRNASYLRDSVSGVKGLRPQEVQPGGVHAYHQFTVVVEAGTLGRSRDQVAEAMDDLGVETAVHYPLPVHQQPVFASSGETGSLPVSESLSQSVLSLPVHQLLSHQDLETVERAIRTVAQPA